MLAGFRRWSTSSRWLGALFLMVLVPSATTLLWLGVQLLEEDRRLWADRDLERRESAADIIVRALEQKLAATATLVEGDLPDGGVFARFDGPAVTVRPPDRILWVPTRSQLTEMNTQAFAEGEIAEFRQTGDLGLAAYTALARSTNPAEQAGALLRLARVHRSTGDFGAAIREYRELARFTDLAFNGMPADLIGRREVCDLLEQTRETATLAREAEALRVEFLAGRWTLDRTGWWVAAEDIERWTGRPLIVPPERQALSAALEWLWQQVRVPETSAADATSAVRRHVIRMDNTSILMLWRAAGSEVKAFILPPGVIAHWSRQAIPPELASADALLLTDEAGAVLSGEKPEAGTRLVTRLATETGLPWNVSLKPASLPRDVAALTSRRRLLGAGLGAIVLLISGGSYLLWRTVRGEMAVARIQTEFVAAVSHEFRTPLTLLQHVTELLEENDELPREQRRSLYAALGRSTKRLRGLVESLLDFARMEDGRKPYDLRPIDPSLLASNVIEEFERQAPSERTVITRDLAMPGTLSCRADVAALAHALWNLLDNAVKYSTEPALVTVSVAPRGDEIAIAVADHGFGIPARERQTIFQKFVRGSDSVRRGINGTGLGLAMVSHIIAAHGGRIELESEEGRGSTFRILLPTRAGDSCVKSARAEAESPTFRANAPV